MTGQNGPAISAGKLWGLRRMATADGFYCMLALDQRPPIMNLIQEKRGLAQAPDAEVAAVKAMIAEHLGSYASAVLVDPIWAYNSSIWHCDPAKGLILTHEDHRFEDLPGGRNSAAIANWNVEKIKRAGGDGVKVLAWYRPDADASVIEHQKDYVRGVGEACRKHDIPFVFELLVYPFKGANDYLEDPEKRPEMVIESVRAFAGEEYGVDLFKLESPIPAEQVVDPNSGDDEAIQATQRWFDQLDEASGRPWVMLSAGAGKRAFKNVLHYAFKAGASGFLAGRAIWRDAFEAYPDQDKVITELTQVSGAYMRDLENMTREHATPWMRATGMGDGPVLAGDANDWPKSYPGLEG